MWKRIQNRVRGRRSSSKPELKDVVDEAVKQEGNNREAKSKVKSPPRKRKEQDEYNTEEMKDVLKLFNKLEELVVEGDPRVRDAINKRPLVQQALMEEGEFTDRSDLSPRIPKLSLGTNREPTFYREESGVSGQPTMYKDKQLTVSDLGVRSPRQTRYTQNGFYSNNPVTVQQTIPENATYSNTYNINNYAGGKMRKLPDGTMLTTTNAPAIVDGQIHDVNPSFTRNEQPVIMNNQPQRPGKNLLQPQIVPKLDLHEFNYETPRGKSKVQVHLRGDDKTHNFNYTNPDAGYQVRVSLDNLPDLKQGIENEKDVTEENHQNPPAESQAITIPAPSKREPLFAKRGNNANWMDIVSKVFTSEGGVLTCSGCRLEVPKNAVPNKALIRVSVMDIQEVPYTSAYTAPNERTPTLLPISAVIKIEPENLVLQKPVTIRLQTSIAMREVEKNVDTTRTKKEKNKVKSTEKDIKAKDIIIQYRNSSTGDLWQKLETDVFRSSDSVMFRTQELSSVCAFHVRDGMNEDVLIKKIAVYIFQSLERRKKQFLSVLVCEDQPHVMQKGVESMPGWLHYMDSCFNISIEEGKNLVVYLEPVNRTLCSVDANKMEIPWQNLWKPECIIRKHFKVTLHKLDTEGFIQLVVNDANYSMNTSFLWQVQRQTIFLPDPVPVENYSLEKDTQRKERIDEMEPEKDREYSNLYKHVTWKPPTPDPQNITNEALLRYATM